MAFRITGCRKTVFAQREHGGNKRWDERDWQRGETGGTSAVRRNRSDTERQIRNINGRAFSQVLALHAPRMNRMCAWIMVGGLAILWLPLGRRCLELSGGDACFRAGSGVDASSGRRLHGARARGASGGCGAADASIQGREGDRSLGVVIRGDLSLDTLPVGPLPPELEGMKELQGREVRVISGSMTIVDSVVRGAIRHGSPQGLLVVKGPVTFSGTRFEQPVDLSRAVFIQPVTLSGARFLRESYFVQGRFLRDVFAENTAFGPHTRFHRSVFQGPVTFQQSGFNGLAEFLEVVFEKDVNLSRTYFKLGTGFSGSRFQGLADFSEASFDRDAFFTFTMFEGDAVLSPGHVPIDGGFFRCVVQGTRRLFQSHFRKGSTVYQSEPDQRPDRHP